MAAKNLPLSGGVPEAKSIEAGSQDWAMTCGACHVGGGQMEYDRNQNDYSASSPAGDYYRYQLPDKRGAGGVVPGWMSSTNKAEVDCLLCHLHDSSKISGNGLAFLKSEGCSASNPIGPKNDPTCTIQPDDSAPYSQYGLTGAMWNPAWAGAKYDMFNRNLAIKAKKFEYAASLGLGATATGFSLDAAGNPTFTGITGLPSSIPAENIQATPNSQNCAVCHARDDSTAGLDGMYHMRFGYGGYELINEAGTAFDSEGTTNAVRWLELGCKTGMGKRAHRIGTGPNDKFNDSKINVMYGLNRPAGTPIANETLTVAAGPMAGETINTYARIPDRDVHDAGGVQCATCHYTLGSTSLEGGSKTIPANTFTNVLPLTEGTIVFPAKTYNGIDHQFAKFGTMEDTNSMPNINGTVSCESCHTTHTHPRYYNADGSAKAVTPFPATPTHTGFPASHLNKISCTTCHIPEVYAAPGRLKYRDFSLGYYKKGSDASGGWRNMLDWNWDFISWGAKPVPPIHVWATRNGQTQIVPVLPSTIPAWEEANTNTAMELNSDAAVSGKTGSCDSTDAAHAGQACASDADCGTGTCNGLGLDMSGYQFFVANPGKGLTPGPVKARDTSAAALYVENHSNVLRRGTTGKGELNGANLVPLFDGFPLSDSWGADTKARIDAMHDAGAGSVLRIYQAARFDVTHGVVPKEWALGGSNRGGCVSCHSSADVWQRDNAGNYIKDADGNPLSNPNYNVNSVGFFEGFQQPFQVSPIFPGVGQYDLIKNWFALFAGFDGTAMTNGLHMTQGFCYNMCVNKMNMPYASCAQFCPSAGSVGSPTSNTAYAALYFCDDGPGGMPDQSTCGVNGHLGGFSMPSLDTGYMMGKTDNQYYDPVSGMPLSSGVVGLQYQCTSFETTGADCSVGLAGAGTMADECGMSGMPPGSDSCTDTPNPYYNAPINPNGRIYANFIMPCWDAQTNPTCAGSTMMNPNYQTEAYDPFLAAVSGFMTMGFDTLMYYAPGTADGLGWYDGIAALRLLTIKETVSGKTLGCDPYGAFDLAHYRSGLLSCVPSNATFNGTCNTTYGMCIGGVAYGMDCQVDADCQGKLTDPTELANNPNGLLWSRAEMRDHFQINLQQSCGGKYNADGSVKNNCSGGETNPLVPGGITWGNARLTWPIGSEANPDNPAHHPAWDQAGKLSLCGKFQDQPCCTDQMGKPVTCADGAYVKTTVHMNQLLGFAQPVYAELTKPALAGASYGSQSGLNCGACHSGLTMSHPLGTGNPYPACATCHTTPHDATSYAPTINVCQSCHVTNSWTDQQFTVLAAGIHQPPKTITVTQTANGTISPYTYNGFLTGMNSTYKIEPNAGYRVADVLVDGVSVGAVTSYTFTNIQADHTITATYTANSVYTITATASGSGSISPAGATSLLGGVSQTYTITPNAGYRIDKVLVDGTNKGPLTSYTFTNVNADHTISASFVSDTYTITASVLSGSGSISPAGATTVNGGGNQTYSFTPAAGYKVSSVTVNGAAVNLAADGTYTFTNVRANYTIGVSFTSITYTITVAQTANGTISPYTYSGFTAGSNRTYTITPNAGYHIGTLTVDGVSQTPATSYTFTNIQADHSITATFAENPPATITATAGANGSISPSGSATVLSGTNQTYSFTPASGYSIGAVTVDGVYKGTSSSYTFINITAGTHTISATFNPTITATAGTGGTMSPSGTSMVPRGGSKTFTITAAAGYHIADVLVDGTSVGAVSTYTFTNVTTPHTISATFGLN